jgi:hypothetical protein
MGITGRVAENAGNLKAVPTKVVPNLAQLSLMFVAKLVWIVGRSQKAQLNFNGLHPLFSTCLARRSNTPYERIMN